MRQQSAKRTCLAVSVCTNHNESGRGEAFGFEPRPATARTISRESMFGNDALQRSLCTCFEQGGTITIEFIAELNPIPIICSKQSPQAGTTLNEGLLAEVLAVEMPEGRRHRG